MVRPPRENELAVKAYNMKTEAPGGMEILGDNG